MSESDYLKNGGKMNSQNPDRSAPGSLEIERKILDRSSRFKVPEGRPAEDSLLLLKARIAEKAAGSANHRMGSSGMLYLVSSIAAGLLIIIGIWQILKRPVEKEILAEYGSHREYKLPDGSEVILNSGSKITWSGKNFNSERHIDLKGEAFFDVAEGNPFTISTKNGNIMVLGTSFNVYSRDNSFKVSCFTGSVLVSALTESVTLSSGESAELSDYNLKSYSDKNLGRTNSWINGEFFYENTCLINVFEEIERQFGVKFDAGGLENEFFTGSFTNRDLRSALDIVCIPMGLSYEIGRNSKISITRISQ